MNENEKSEKAVCARCGASVAANALQGLCPACLLRLNLATQTEIAGEKSGPADTHVIMPPLPAPPSREEIAQLFPQLEILECLGRGGMGAVYKARQPRLDRYVALKILLRGQEGSATQPSFAERFAREARALARLNHPNIVAVYDYGEAGGHPYLIMEFVDGLTLRQLLKGGKLAPETALEIVPKICEALQFAHEQGVVHRDIKPENILLDQQGRVKIADFGIAKIVAPGAQDLSLTGGKDVVGTPHYMAPEQIEQPGKVDHRADIFSLGVVFYEMLTGQLPLGKFQPPSRKVQIDVRLDEVVLHALEKEPERRYQHASEVKSDVEIITTSAAPGEGGATSGPVLKSWRDLWPWDNGYIALYLLAPVVLAGIAVPVLFQFIHFKAFWIWTAELLGMLFALMYFIIGRKVRKACAQVPKESGEVTSGLMFKRPLQSPAAIVLNPVRLELIPIMGKRIVIPLQDIAELGEVRWFNGTRLWFKKGIVLTTKDGQHVGLAIPDPYWRRWRSRLSRGQLSELPPAVKESAETKPRWWSPRKLLIAVVALMVIGELVWLAAPKNPDYIISGRVLDIRGDPIPGATVSVRREDKSEPLRQVKTDPAGQYSLKWPQDADLLYWQGRVRHSVTLVFEASASNYQSATVSLSETHSAGNYRRAFDFRLGAEKKPVQAKESDQNVFTVEHRSQMGTEVLNASRNFVMEHQWNLASESGDGLVVAIRAEDRAGKKVVFEEALYANDRAQLTIATEPGIELSAQRIGAAICQRLGLLNPYPSRGMQTPTSTDTKTGGTDWNRAVALFNEIEDFGHEFDAAFTSTNLAAAQTAIRRFSNLISNYNAAVTGTEYAFPSELNASIQTIRKHLDAGDWQGARKAAAHDENYAREFRRISKRMAEIALQEGTFPAVVSAVQEVVLPDPDQKLGKEAINLRTGNRADVPMQEVQQPGRRIAWLAASRMDLYFEYDNFVSHRWALIGSELKLADFPKGQWGSATAAQVTQALRRNKTSLESIERWNAVFYLLPPTLPQTMTLAFETREGASGLLSIDGFTKDPEAVKIRYKLVKLAP